MVNAALDHMLAHQEPYPALVVDAGWNLLRGNRGALRLTAFLNGGDAGIAGPANLADLLLAPSGWRPLIENWPEVALYFLRDVQSAALTAPAPESETLLARLLA